MSLSLMLVLLAIVLNNVSGQDQCDPAQYVDAGNYIKTYGYKKTCDNRKDLRDCVGCNQACISDPCEPALVGTANDYAIAGSYIASKKDELGWLNLCCEYNSPSQKKFVGCQQANIFNILCGWVYPPLKAAIGYSGASNPLSILKNNNEGTQGSNKVNNNLNTIEYSIIVYIIGLLSGCIILSIFIGIIYCFTKKRSQYEKVKSYDTTTTNV